MKIPAPDVIIEGLVAIDQCLPPELRGPRTTVSKIATGFSGAAVYRVDADGNAYVLKLAAEKKPTDDWRRALFILHAASSAGLAPRVVHVDESRQAILSEFVTDQSFPRFYRDPRTHEAALVLLGQTLRRVHKLPVPPHAAPSRPRELLGAMWSGRWASATLPPFVTEIVERTLAEQAPPPERALVLSHNDVNPSNFVLDGARILFLDWDAAAPNDPFFDLAVASLFNRMDAETSRRLIAAYDGAAPLSLAPSFRYYRRLAGVMLGVGFLSLAALTGNAGVAPETLDAVPPLAEFYQKLHTGALTLASGEGRWAFGLGLMKEAHALE